MADTERASRAQSVWLQPGFKALDPMADTESSSSATKRATAPCFKALDPMADTERQHVKRDKP